MSAADLLDTGDYGATDATLEAQGKPCHRTEDECRIAAREEMLLERQRQLERENAGLADTVRRLIEHSDESNEELRRLAGVSALQIRALRNLNHECRSPLHSICGMTTLLLRCAPGELSCEQEQLVRSIRKAADALVELLDDLADPEKLEQARVAVRPAQFEAADLLDTLKGMIPAPLTKEGVRLIFESPAGVPWLYSDQGKLLQILRNLLNNALKFTDQGEIRVSLTHDPSSETVRFSVSDTGTGISADDQKRLTEAWAGCESELPSGRRGLGLPLCRALAAALGGWITMESALGRGSTFSLLLPRHYRAEHSDQDVLSPRFGVPEVAVVTGGVHEEL